MTLPDDDVINFLENHFILGHKNIHKDEHVGMSRGYSKTQHAVGTTNGAGGRNVQFLVIAPDGVVLHALPGFWHPEDLARELRFAKVAARLWEDDTRTRAQKDRMLVRLHLAEIRRQSPETYARSGWQDFDERTERARAQREARDTVLTNALGEIIGMKPLNVLAHERVLQQPFVPFTEFDIGRFVDYGTLYYDLNQGRDHARVLPRAGS